MKGFCKRDLPGNLCSVDSHRS